MNLLSKETNYTMRNLEFHFCEMQDQVRKIRDTFGDDKCYEDWHKLFAMLPEGFTPPKQDIAVQLEHCERFLKCRAAGIEYVPPPRWVVGPPDKIGLWIITAWDGSEYLFRATGTTFEHAQDVKFSFGPIPKEP